MNQFPPPNPMTFEGNVAENWRRWIQQFRLYLNATGLDKKPQQQQCSCLLTVAGPEALEIFNTFALSDTDQTKIEVVINKFEEYCTPKKNVTYERHLFNTRAQGETEGIDAYVTELRKLARNCEFGELHDSLIRDRIVCGIRSNVVRKRLLREKDLNLERAVEICKSSEITDNQLKNIVVDQDEREVNEVKSDSKKPPVKPKGGKGKPRQTKKSFNCRRCGEEHEPKKCPAYGQICHKCKQRNHYAKVCRSKPRDSSKQVDEYRLDDDSDTDEFFIGVLGAKPGSQKNWMQNVVINNLQVNMKLDTGAQCNVLPYSLYCKLTREKLRKSNTRLVSYTGHKIPVMGKATLPVKLKGKFHPVEFHVIEHPATPVIGLQTCNDLNLVKRVSAVDTQRDENSSSDTSNLDVNEILKKYEDVFDGIGCLEGAYRIKIDSSVTPVVHPPRKIPFTQRENVKEELDRMEALGVIRKADEPTEWVSSLVVVQKPNGKVRVCLDPRDLNKAIQRKHYPMKTVEEVAAELSDAKVFSVLDATSGFWHIKLDEASTQLLTFNTPFGRYQYLRMPFGINSAPEVFQKKMTQAFEDLSGVKTIADDILIWGKDEDEHNFRLEQVLKRSRKVGLKLNRSKMKIMTTEVPYIGHILTANGLKPDPSKVQAVEEMPSPADKPALLRFLGMVNYMSKFIPNLAELTQPLRELLHKDVAWHWSERQEKAFRSIKGKLTSDAILQYYDVEKSTTVSVDASSYGLGACLLQEGRPVCYASRSLSSAERNYAQIEKELLAIVYGCTKFHQYVYGKKVRVQTDHKPLEALFRKPLFQAPQRLQRMMLRLQRYDLQVEYEPGKNLYIADTLSRAPEGQNETAANSKDEFEVLIIENMPVSEEKLEQFKQETRKDPTLQKLKNTVLNGWPESKSQSDPELHGYWNFKEEITVCDDLLLRSDRLIVPDSLRGEMLSKIHSSHLGIGKCKRRARDVLFWPGMNQQITDMISKCNTCNTYRNAQAREPLKSHELPGRPWQKIAVDLFVLDKQDYVVIVDYYSKFFEVSHLPNSKSKTVINHIKPHLARYGIPEIIISDNGPEFSSHEFEELAKHYGFKHITSSPTYSQSNGLVE